MNEYNQETVPSMEKQRVQWEELLCFEKAAQCNSVDSW
jgi:hypothetical protein